MAQVVRETMGVNTPRRHLYWCPGCDEAHSITIRPDVQANGAGWDFTGTLEAPTYHPSQLTRFSMGDPPVETVCHTFIRNGQIEFLGDCTHELRGQTVPMQPLPDWLLQEKA